MAQVRHKGRFSRKALLGFFGALAVAAALGVGVYSYASGGVVVQRSGGEEGSSGVSATSDAAASGAVSTQGGEGKGSDASAAAPAATTVAAAKVLVHVDGAVAAPGVYELAMANPRVNDAVSAAGGLTGEADTGSVNLAAIVSDGSKVHIPVQGEEVSQDSSSGASSGSGTSSSSSSGGLVNINTATAEELDALPGVGPSTAAAIVDDRERNGPFSSPEDLMRVSGIGEKKFAKLQGSICV